MAAPLILPASTCPQCGAPLRGDASEGICQKCLLNLAAVAGVSGQVRLWDNSSSNLLSLAGHAGEVLALKFDAAGRRLLTCAKDRTARVWNTTDGRQIGQPFEHPDEVAWGEFSPDGSKILTVCRDGKARLWNAATGKLLLRPVEPSGPLRSARFSPDGRSFVTTTSDATYAPGAAQLWDATNGASLSIPPMQHQDGITTVEFSADGRRLATGGEDNAARVWDTQTGRAVGPAVLHQSQIHTVALSPAGRQLLTGSSDLAQSPGRKRPELVGDDVRRL